MQILHKRRAPYPVWIVLPDGRRIQSTHIADLAIPWAHPAARIVRIVPGLQGCNLLSLGQLCDAGYETRLDKEWVTLWREQHCIFKGERWPIHGMWQLAVNNCERGRYHHHQGPYTHKIMNRLADKTIAERIQYAQHSFGSPPATRMEKATKAGVLINVPGLTIER
jgi:hypothetical protein